MPSPVGHSVIGLALGCGYALPPVRCRGLWRAARASRGYLLFAVLLANLPDIDYVPGLLAGDLNAFHHGYTHTIGWVFLVGFAVWLLWRRRRPGAGLSALVFVLALLLSHLLADLVTGDGSRPYGIMFFWPFSDAYVISPVTIFWRPLKDTVRDMFQWHNVVVMLVEVLWTLPLPAGVLLYKCRRAARCRANFGIDTMDISPGGRP